ncbi:hypothetical protein FACS189472_13520 [Alphaproteobacteria bacterium]|nr:hypothetical protein FACS189472_13520 [Alphaproteobacteria bacterium]
MTRETYCWVGTFGFQFARFGFLCPTVGVQFCFRELDATGGFGNAECDFTLYKPEIFQVCVCVCVCVYVCVCVRVCV